MFNNKQKLIIFILLACSLISSCSGITPEERDFNPDVYKNYTIIDEHLTYIEAGDVFGTIKIEESGVGVSSLRFRKIKDTPANEFVAGSKVGSPPFFGTEVNVYSNAECTINPLVDWRINCIQIINRNSMGGVYDIKHYGKCDIIDSTTEEGLLNDICISTQGLSEAVSSEEIINQK